MPKDIEKYRQSLRLFGQILCGHVGSKSVDETAALLLKEIEPELNQQLKELDDPAGLLALFAHHAQGQNPKILGAAYWNTMGTAVGTGVAKAVFGGLLGPLGMALAGREHRAGIVAVTDTELFLVDLGMVVGEDLTLNKMRGAVGSPSVEKVPLRSLTAACDVSAGVLILNGGTKIKATFPSSFAQENPSKAALIARVIQSQT